MDTNTADRQELNFKDVSEMLKQKPIGQTPFVLNDFNGKYFGSLGNIRLTEYYDNEEDVIEYFSNDKITWEKLIQVIACTNTLYSQVLKVSGAEVEEKL